MDKVFGPGFGPGFSRLVPANTNPQNSDVSNKRNLPWVETRTYPVVWKEK